MIGAIIGDVLGSTYETHPKKFEDINRIDLYRPSSTFTDDTVLTIAVAQAVLSFGDSIADKGSAARIRAFRNHLRSTAIKYPDAGYGQSFQNWFSNPVSAPYNSHGNGSAMRVGPIGFLDLNIEMIQKLARESAKVTHNHPQGIRGAQVIASAVFLANQGESKDGIENYLNRKFNCRIEKDLSSVREKAVFDISARISVPIALACFFASNDFESTIRNAISIGGDSDTLACMAGVVAQAYYKRIPRRMKDFVFARIDLMFKETIREYENVFEIVIEYT